MLENIKLEVILTNVGWLRCGCDVVIWGVCEGGVKLLMIKKQIFVGIFSFSMEKGFVFQEKRCTFVARSGRILR